MSQTKSVALFPGQGAYYRGALASLQLERPEIHEVFAQIDGATRDLLGRQISESLLTAAARDIDTLLADDPDMLQLAIYGTSVAAYRILERAGFRASVMVGHSLGEVAALTCAGAFTVEDGARIICHRNQALRESNLESAYMAAIGTDVARAQSLLDLVGGPGAAVAVENHDGQTVVSGHGETLDRAAAVAATLRLGFRKLKSPYPFHSPLLRPAVELFADRIAGIPQSTPAVPVHSPILGRLYRPMDDITWLLATHFVRPLKFSTAIRELYASGASVYVECGALDALTRIVGRILANAEVTAIASLTSSEGERESMAQALRRLGCAPAARPAAVGESAAGGDSAAGVESVGARGGPVGAEVVLAELVSTYALALEYPTDVFSPDTDLESELGVDSVKQTELLARVSDHYGLPPRPPEFRLGEYNTLGKIADLILTSA
jgi:acyl transferase domain-containing protein/acyl carrier protein